MLPAFATQTITILTPTITVVRGVETRDWSTPVRTVSEGWSVQGLKAGRDFEYGSGVIDAYRCYGPLDTVLPDDARIEIPDESGQFTITDGPTPVRSATDLMGISDDVSHTVMTVERRK